jgi:hypothetical protein
MKSFCFLDNHTHSLWIWRGGTGCTWKHIRTQDHQFQILVWNDKKKLKKNEEKKKKKRIINAHYRHPQPDHSASSFFSLSPSVLTRQSLSLACAITHTIIIICSRYARRALAPCSLFKIFLPFSLLLLSSDHSKKGERERE